MELLILLTYYKVQKKSSINVKTMSHYYAAGYRDDAVL